MFMVAHQSDAAVMALFGQSIKDSPTLTEILSVLANIYRTKNTDYVDKLRRKFINVTPCTQEWRLQQSLIAWESMRDELKCRGNEQGDQECLGSLKRLLSGLPRILTMIEHTEFTLQIKVGLDRMLQLAKTPPPRLWLCLYL